MRALNECTSESGRFEVYFGTSRVSFLFQIGQHSITGQKWCSALSHFFLKVFRSELQLNDTN